MVCGTLGHPCPKIEEVNSVAFEVENRDPGLVRKTSVSRNGEVQRESDAMPIRRSQCPRVRHNAVKMRSVKSKDTLPELKVLRLLYRMGYRYRLHRKNFPGKPDIVFVGKRKLIFVHSCIWHGHDCKRGSRKTVTNKEYWENKITRKIERFARQLHLLEAAG